MKSKKTGSYVKQIFIQVTKYKHLEYKAATSQGRTVLCEYLFQYLALLASTSTSTIANTSKSTCTQNTLKYLKVLTNTLVFSPEISPIDNCQRLSTR